MKQSPERKRIVRKSSQLEEAEDEDEDYQLIKRDMEEMRLQQQQMQNIGSDDEDSFDQLEVEEPFE